MQTSHSRSPSPSFSQDRQHLVKCQLGINIVATTTEERERGCEEHCRRGIRRYSHSYLTRNNHKISQTFLPPSSLLGDNTHTHTHNVANASSGNFLLGGELWIEVGSEWSCPCFVGKLFNGFSPAHFHLSQKLNKFKFRPIPRVHHEFHYATQRERQLLQLPKTQLAELVCRSPPP